MARRPPRGAPRRRAVPRRQIRQLLVFVEGEKTEDSYFKYWSRLRRHEVIVNIHEFKGADPFSLVTRAAAEQKHEMYEARHQRGEPHDEIWCVFDVDAHPKLTEAIDLAARHGIYVAVSNPCFELWLVLHYQDQTASIDRHPVQRLAKAHLKCGKALSSSVLVELASRYDSAIRRAQYLDKMHDGNGSGTRANPSSEVWKLVERINKP